MAQLHQERWCVSSNDAQPQEAVDLVEAAMPEQMHLVAARTKRKKAVPFGYTASIGFDD